MKHLFLIVLWGIGSSLGCDITFMNNTEYIAGRESSERDYRRIISLGERIGMMWMEMLHVDLMTSYRAIVPSRHHVGCS